MTSKPYPTDAHHPATQYREFIMFADSRVIRFPVEDKQLRVLQINHPQHGWMSFIIEERRARELIKNLQASLPPAP